MSADLLVEVTGLVRRFGALTAVGAPRPEGRDSLQAPAAGLSFDVRRGEMFGLIGPDGAGKTTTLRVILGLLAPHAGSVRTCGLDPLHERRALSSRVGYLSQRFSLYGDLTVDENIGFFADIHGVSHWQALRDELLEMVRMTPFRKRLAARLSGGMKQKLALACTLIHTPELLVLDEPTTGVDPVSRRDFWRLLSRLQRDGLTLLLTTPYLDEAERCQRVALLDHGRLLTLDAPDALRAAEPGAMIEVIARPRREAVALLRTRPGVTDVEVFGERAHVHLPAVPRGQATVAADELQHALLAAGFGVDLIRPTVPSLEDVFIARLRAADPTAETEEARP